MVEGALNAAAEQIVEYSAYGGRMERDGNRCPECAPQGVYACRGLERWLALSVADDDQWRALVGVLGEPAWARDPELAHRAGRRAHHDRIDAELERWTVERELEATVSTLLAAGVPAAPVFDGRLSHRHPQLRARGFLETLDHPVVGRHPIPTVPFRFASRDAAGRPWIRRPGPTLGQHNREILGELLGLESSEIDSLEQAGVIGTRPRPG